MTDLNNEINVPQPGSPRFESDVAKAIGRIRFALGPEGNPAHESLTLLGLTASKLVGSDADKALASVDLIDFVAGTADEITVADDGSGGITIGLADPLIVGKGGTGLATLTDHGILLGSGTGAVTPLAAASNGQLPIGSTGVDPVLATLTGTADQIAVTNGAGSITLSLTGGISDIAGLTPTDGNFIVGDGANWVAESGATARTSLGLGTGDSPTLTGLTLSGLTQGSVVFAGASGVISQDNSNLFWDDTNNRLGIGTTTPGYYDLEISGSGDGVGVSAINSTYGSATLAARYGGYFVDFYNNSASGGVSFRSRRSRGTAGTPLTCQDGDFIGEFTFHQYDGSDFEQLGGILYVASDVSDDKGQTIFYYYDGVAKYIASFDKDETKLGDVDGTDYVQISSTTGNLTFQGGSGFYPRVLNQSAEPAAGTGATQCDTGEAVIWTDTDDSKCYWCYNHGGTVKTVEIA